MNETWSPYKITQLESMLTERDGRILTDLETYRALSTRHIQRLEFPAGIGGLHATIPTATRLTIRTLLRLESHGFIARLPRRVGGTVRGSAATTWHLGGVGERMLRARRGTPTRRRYMVPSHSFLAHTLAVAEVAVELRERAARGELELLAISVDPDSWRPFNGPAGTLTLKPDLHVVIASPDLEAHAFVEIDRGTEHLPTIVAKCRTYLQYRQTGTEQATHDIFPIVIWAVPDDRRADQLRTAIRREPTIPNDLFTICTHDDVVSVLTASLNPKGGTL